MEERRFADTHALLEGLKKEDALPVCMALLQALPALDAFLFVVQFVLRAVKLNAIKAAALRDTELGCLLLSHLPEHLQARLRPAVAQPRYFRTSNVLQSNSQSGTVNYSK